MASKEEVMEGLQKWLAKLDNPEVAEEFKDYNKTFLISFPDLELDVQMIFDNGAARLEEGTFDNPDMSITMESDMFAGIISGDVDPQEAFMLGKLRPKGDMNDLEKLSLFMED
ncbi:MAG TPA: SCP2 sterol-binding domain-containing protein [Candidatus Lokiarchaeia archaeon]|nr:SCP2 sterol-binding domain-containing protein [Candidatus Lokiarchaeia archaeon]